MVMGLRERAGHALAVNGVWGNMGVAAAALATAMLSDWVDWRAAFLVPGLAMLGIGCAYAAIPTAAQTEVAATRHNAASLASTRLRVFAFIAISGLFGGLIFNGASIALPKLLAERLPEVSLVVGILAALVFAAAAFAQLPVGRLLDRWDARPLLFTIEGTKTPLLLAMALVPGWSGAAFAMPVMLLVFGEIPITAWLLGRHLGERWWSRAYAVQYLLSLGIAAATVPLIAALHRATGDQTALFLVLAACSATILLGTFLVPRRTSSASCESARPASALAG
jgi:MFS family permease